MKTFADMIEGYGRFREGDWQRQHDRWEQLKGGQSPQVMVIACSDSRVDPAQIFDVDPGEIFVVRNVAALVPPFETTPGRHGVSAALEFAVQFLKVREVVVMGHGMCGGCKAALTATSTACDGADGWEQRQVGEADHFLNTYRPGVCRANPALVAAIVGGAVGGSAILCCCVAAVVCCLCLKKKKKKAQASKPPDAAVATPVAVTVEKL